MNDPLCAITKAGGEIWSKLVCTFSPISMMQNLVKMNPFLFIITPDPIVSDIYSFLERWSSNHSMKGVNKEFFL